MAGIDPSLDMEMYMRTQIRSAFDMFDKDRKGCVIQEYVHANFTSYCD